MSKVHCVPHETGISFTYDGVQYVYNADGFWHVGEEACNLWRRVTFRLLYVNWLSIQLALRGTGPRATAPKKPSYHRRARACPSPCIDRDSKRPSL